VKLIAIEEREFEGGPAGPVTCKARIRITTPECDPASVVLTMEVRLRDMPNMPPAQSDEWLVDLLQDRLATRP
jgi:hypothetical protein